MTTASPTPELVDALKGPIVVFGASGFIGTNLLRALLARRADVFGVTHQSFVPWRLLDLPAGNVLHADVTSRADVKRLFSQYRFQTIFCLQAYGGYARQSDPDTIYRTNVLGLVNVVDVAAVHGFAALVHAGSQSEYGTNCSAPGESAALAPNSHYAVSKVSAAYLLQFLAESRGLPTLNLRYYSVYGPYEESDRLIAKVVSEGAAGRLPPLVDPDISRDFVYVDDAVEATLRAAALGVTAAPGASLNIASGTKTTIRDVAATARDVFALTVEPRWGAMANRSWDLKEWWGDPTRASDVLGWTARTSFREGLERTRDWYRVSGARAQVASLQRVQKVPRLSAVIACYKDAPAVPVMYERLTATFAGLGVDYEIIFVNDASPDDAATALAALAGDHHVVVIEHSRNFGSQSAFLSGMEIATGDAVILLDGDLQDPPELIAAFFTKWREGFEVVYGQRVARDAGFVLRVCYRAFYRVLRAISYVPIPLDAGDFSLMDRKVVDQILALPETDQFLRGLRAWVGFRQIGVPYRRPERMFGTTTNNWRRNLWWARKAFFSFSFVPLELMLYLGVGLTAASFLLGLAQIAAKLMHVDAPHGVTTIIVAILFFGGVQILGLSILGEYVGKVLEESKRRPKYIRRVVTRGGVEASVPSRAQRDAQRSA